MIRLNEIEIRILKDMLNYHSINYPLLKIAIPRNRNDVPKIMSVLYSLYDKGALDDSGSPWHLRLSSRFATMAGVVSERKTEQEPLRWMRKSDAIRLRLKREGRIIRQREKKECDLTHRYKGKFSMNSFPDHRRWFDESETKIIGISNQWNGKHDEICPVCNNKPAKNEFCLKCNRQGPTS